MTFISQYYPLGSLGDVIHRKSDIVKDADYTSTFMVALASDIITAVYEMHNRGIIHNDLKPANMLLSKDEYGTFFVVLCDFGIATIVSNPVFGIMTFGMSKARGASAAYAAPEVFARLKTGKGPEEPDLKKAADVYAYGISIFELISRQQPWDSSLKTSADIEFSVMEGKRPVIDDSIARKRETDKNLNFLCSIMELSWLANPAARPTAEALSRTFRSYKIVV
jgi:serine/threonine protein kinase, bacterial